MALPGVCCSLRVHVGGVGRCPLPVEKGAVAESLKGRSGAQRGFSVWWDHTSFPILFRSLTRPLGSCNDR